MLIMAQPVFDCFEDTARKLEGKSFRNIYMSPSGKRLEQEDIERLSEYDALNILCGHYEGIDQRIIDGCIDEELSIGDYVLMGGELPAMVLMDCVMRYSGALSNPASHDEESFYDGLLEYPQYTRPSSFRGMDVPEVLLNGNHRKIKEWQREQSLAKTLRVRPDLLEKAALSEEDEKIIKKIKSDVELF